MLKNCLVLLVVVKSVFVSARVVVRTVWKTEFAHGRGYVYIPFSRMVIHIIGVYLAISCVEGQIKCHETRNCTSLSLGQTNSGKQCWGHESCKFASLNAVEALIAMDQILATKPAILSRLHR